MGSALTAAARPATGRALTPGRDGKRGSKPILPQGLSLSSPDVITCRSTRCRTHSAWLGQGFTKDDVMRRALSSGWRCPSTLAAADSDVEEGARSAAVPLTESVLSPDGLATKRRTRDGRAPQGVVIMSGELVRGESRACAAFHFHGALASRPMSAVTPYK